MNRPIRKARRIAHNGAVTLKSAMVEPIRTTLSNLSIGGAHLLTQRTLPPGTLCELLLIVHPNGRSITLLLRAFVAHNDATGIGVQFITPEPNIRALLKGMIAAQPVAVD